MSPDLSPRKVRIPTAPYPQALLRRPLAASRRPQRQPCPPHRTGALLLPSTVVQCPLPGGRGVSVGPILSSSASDIFCDNENGPNFLFHNRGDGTFVDAAASAGECSHCPVPLSTPRETLGCPAPSSMTPQASGRVGRVILCTTQGNVACHLQFHSPGG